MKKTLPLWAGLECTRNRIGSRYVDQCEKNGHHQRLQDLEMFAHLGVEKIRYPFLWELAAPRRADEIDWTWADERMAELRRLNLSPIAGFCHHGSGPEYTSLLDPEFPEKFAYYALRFAQRYPDVRDYTPINEPLTTARFSGLYGVWYPHHRQDQSFVYALWIQIKATLLAMRAIRETNPHARLIQTEDFGRTQSTSSLQYQADFENERRWLSFDLLRGRVDHEHPLYEYLLRSGMSAEDFKWLRDHALMPDVIGINHYLLSNRFLDDRLELYPSCFHGGNEKDRYADVGVVDTTAADTPEPSELLQEVWDRYHQPIAITEVHVNGPREMQMRWLYEIYQAAQSAQQRGVDVKAVTAWSLLGSYDWNSLCVEPRDYYESGVFDVRAPKPRPTALAHMIEALSNTGSYSHPVLDLPGWWKDKSKGLFGPRVERNSESLATQGRQPLLITGARGTLGRAFARICELRQIPYRTFTREKLNICDEDQVRQVLEELNPWALINTAGYVRVDDAEREASLCFQYNVVGPQTLAKVAAERDCPLVHFSSDLVFSGDRTSPYFERDEVSPLNIYGRSKVEAEKAVLQIHEKSLIVRSSSFFGPWDSFNFISNLMQSISRREVFRAAQDITISPTYVPDLVEATLDLLLDGERGLLHLVNQGFVTWSGLAERALEMQGGDKALLYATPACEMGFTAPRPAFSALDSERVRILPHHENALERYFSALDQEFIV